MKVSFVLLFALLLSLAFSSCDWDSASEPAIVNVDTCIQPAGRLVTYVEDIKPILETYCTNPSFGSCHQTYADGGSGGLDYTTYDGIKTEADNGKLLDRVIGPYATGVKMPLSSSYGSTTLTPCDTFEIHQWVNEGAPEQ